MGKNKIRTAFINEQINKTSDAEVKKLLANGFIPDSLKGDYDAYISSNSSEEPDQDIDKISNANYFANNPDKVAGKIVAGTGFLNPTLTKGTINEAIDTINNTLTKSPEITIKKQKEQTKMEPLDEVIKRKFKHLSNQQLINRANAAPDFGWDDEGYELERRRKESKGAFNYKMEGNKLVIVEAEENTKKEQMEIETPSEITPEIDITALEIVVNNSLITGGEKEKKKKYTVSETLRKYNPGISDNEIKAWVYHKRRFGNPMKGWEDFFIKGTGATENVLLTTIKETVVKDNAYRDLRTIPAGVTVGLKTKFKNVYGTEHLIICRTEQGELLWININDVKESKNASIASQSEIDKLVNDHALVFDGNEYFPYPAFLFGDVYQKLDLLNENKDNIIEKYGEAIFNSQIEEISKYKPKLKSFRDPLKSNRPHILSLSAFAQDPIQFGIKELNEEVNIKIGFTKRGRFYETEENVSLFDAFVTWMDEAVRDTDIKGTNKANIHKYYFAKSIKWPKDSEGKDELSQTQKDELVGIARIAAEDLFSEFLATALSFEDSVALDNIWNKKYNAFSNIIQFVDKIPIAYDGSAMFKGGSLDIKPAQRQGLAYLQLAGSGCLAYDVGFGKTLTGILNLAQLVSQGAVKRPLIVVPKPTYKNWLKELFGYWTDGDKVSFNEFPGSIYHYGVFSGTNIKVNDWYNLSGSHYQNLLKNNGGDINKTIPENTITVVSYKGFEQMGFSRNITDEMFESIARVVMQKEATGDAKEAAKQYEKILSWLGRGNKGALIDVDVCGFDHLTVDEAHNFKNVFESCGKDPETGRKLFGISAGQSSRAVKMFFISNYIQLKHGKNIALLTATPFTNSPLEIYSMLSFIGLESLNKYSLFNIKKFFEQFVLQTIEYSIDAKGEIITKPVIKSFMNLKLLQTVLYNHFHYKDNPKEAGVVRPCKIDFPNKDVSTYLEMNEFQRRNQDEVKMMAKSVSRENPGAVLKAINMSLDNAFSPYVFAKQHPETPSEFIDNSPKIKYVMECVKSIKEWHESRGEACSGIVLYSNRGKDYFDYIKQYLIEEIGFKRKLAYDDEFLDEVEIITGGGGEADEDFKELVKDAFNSGIVKIIIGTATIREGVNLQARGTVLFDLYPEWNPTDVIQLKGRIWRQGNKYGYIRFVMPLVINSMDNFINQKLDEKSKRISSIWHSLGDSNISENTSDLDPSEIKMELVDDANEKLKIKLETIKAEMNREYGVLKENKKILSGIGGNVASLLENEGQVYGELASKKPSWVEYLDYLKTLNIKNLREDGLKKTADDAEKVIKYLNELLESLNNYSGKRNDISLSIATVKLMTMRGYNVFTDMSDKGKEISGRINSIVQWRTFSHTQSWAYKQMIAEYSILKKAEKSVLRAYGKAWHDDISEIVEKIDSEIEAIEARAQVVMSDEYKDGILNEITAEMDAKKAIRGDLDAQVERFKATNYIMSYLSDNTDREGCPIPTTECCSTNGVDIVYQDKTIAEEVIMPEVTTTAETVTGGDELTSAIDMLGELLPDLKGKQKKECMEAIEMLKEMQGGEKMGNGGSIGFIPMDLEQDLAIIAKWGGTNIKGVIGFLNAMVDSGITDKDLKYTPTKNTSFQRTKAEDAKIKEVWSKIEPKYKGDLKGNMYYSPIKKIISMSNSGSDILKRYRPFRKFQYAKGGNILSNSEIIKNIDFEDSTDLKVGRYDFSFETEDADGSPMLDYDGYIQEYKDERRGPDVEWGMNTPEDWEKAEEILLNAFSEWRHKQHKQYANGGSVGEEMLYYVVGKKNGQLVEVSTDSKGNTTPMTKQDAERFAKDMERNYDYNSIDIIPYRGKNTRVKYANGGGVGEHKFMADDFVIGVAKNKYYGDKGQVYGYKDQTGNPIAKGLVIVRMLDNSGLKYISESDLDFYNPKGVPLSEKNKKRLNELFPNEPLNLPKYQIK